MSDSDQRLFRLAIPVLHISDAKAAEAFYCDRLGFKRHFAYRIDEATSNPCYMGIERDGIWMHLSSFSGDGIAGNVVNFLVSDVDALHQEFVQKGIPIHLAPTDQDWGNREMYVRDPDGNSIRFVTG